MALTPVILDYIRTVLSLGMLGYASYVDLKTREIHDYVWIFPAAAGLIVAAYELFTGTLSLNQMGFSVGFMVVLSGFLWYFQLFGEADLIAFVALSIIHPRTPDYSFIGYTPLLFSFTLIANSALSGVLSAFYTFADNISKEMRGVELFKAHPDVSTLSKIGLMFTGQYKQMKEIRGPPFEYPLEVRGKLVLKPDLWDDDKAKKEFRILREKGRERIWVSATLPYIVVLFVGYLISVTYGDIMFTLMAYATG